MKIRRSLHKHVVKLNRADEVAYEFICKRCLKTWVVIKFMWWGPIYDDRYRERNRPERPLKVPCEESEDFL